MATIPIIGNVTVGGAAKEISGGHVNIGGVWKPIAKSYTNINGVWKPTWKELGTPIGSLEGGSTVFMNVNGVRKEWRIVNQGLPSSDYDSSCDGTWLLEEDIHESRAWDSSDNDYANSDIHSYLNNTFINLFDSDIRSVIKQVKIPYTKGTGKGGTLTTGSSGLSAKVFLLSYTELGYSGGAANAEGAAVSYFNGAADSKRVAKLNGSATYWWLRSPYNVHTSAVWLVYTSGAADYRYYVTSSHGVRPALVLPSDTVYVDDNMNVII